MPPLQVISRQPDPSAQALQQFGNNVSNTLAQQQALKLKALTLKTNAKNAENEQQKLEFNRQAQFLETAQKMKEIGADPKTFIPALIDMFGKEETVKNLQVLGESLGQAPGTQQEQLRGAQRQALQGALGGQSQEAQGGGLVTGLNVGGTQVAFPEAAGRLARTETLARERAKVEAQLEPVQRTISGFRSTFQNAVNEIGGVGRTALGARLKGGLKSFESEVGNLPNVQSFKRIRGAAGLQIASFINRGRPTEPDREAAEKILPNITYPQATNEALNSFMDSILSIGTAEVGPGNEYLGSVGSIMVDQPLRFVEEGRKNGLSESAINEALSRYYKSVGAL